jgi:hypothetical protein
VRVTAIAALAWLTAALTTSLAFAVVSGEKPSAEDLLGHGIVTFVTGAVLLLVSYLPVVWLLRRRLGERLSPMQAMTATGVMANLPAFAVLALLSGRADLFAGGEAAWLALQFLLFGLLFGLGFARYGQPAA